MIFVQEGLLGLAICAFLSSTLLPGSSEALLLWLVNQNNNNLMALLIVASVANTAGGFFTYWMGIWTKKGLERFRRRKHPTINSLRYISRWGYPALLLSWLPVVGDGLCLAAGCLQLKWLPSLAAIFIGKALRYVAMAYLFLQV